MAVPKGKISKARRNSRKANWKASSPSIVKDPATQEYVLQHRVNKNTGYYNGKKVFEVNKEEKK